MIESTRAVEAITNLRAIREAIYRCYINEKLTRTLATHCNCVPATIGWNGLALDDPGLSPGAHFDYSKMDCGVAFVNIIAYRNTLDGGSGNLADHIVLQHSDPLPAMVQGFGAYKSLRN